MAGYYQNENSTLSLLHGNGDKKMKKLALVVVSLMTAFGSVTSAQAFPSAAGAPAGVTAVQQAQYREGDPRYVPRDARRYDENRYDRGNRYERDSRYDRRDRYTRRHDNRRRDNTGAIIGGLAAGAIIGGAVANQRRTSGMSDHVQWCADRYRSYRAYDNTYVPRAGVRAQCNSSYN
jgi:hypothetical protein